MLNYHTHTTCLFVFCCCMLLPIQLTTSSTSFNNILNILQQQLLRTGFFFFFSFCLFVCLFRSSKQDVEEQVMSWWRWRWRWSWRWGWGWGWGRDFACWAGASFLWLHGAHNLLGVLSTAGPGPLAAHIALDLIAHGSQLWIDVCCLLCVVVILVDWINEIKNVCGPIYCLGCGESDLWSYTVADRPRLISRVSMWKSLNCAFSSNWINIGQWVIIYIEIIWKYWTGTF